MPLWQAIWGSDIHKLSGKIFKASEVSDITDTPTDKGSFMRLPCQKLQLGYLSIFLLLWVSAGESASLEITASSLTPTPLSTACGAKIYKPLPGGIYE